MNNMIKYADATVCETSLLVENHRFILQVKDNGKGFDGNIKGSGHGWKNMKNRADALDGILSIDTTLGNGTAISVNIPFPFKIPSSWDRNQKI